MARMKTSNFYWKKQLSENLKNPAHKPDRRIAIVGIGSELHGDDAVGIEAARALIAGGAKRENLLVLEGSTLPESVSGQLRRFIPDLVIFIDAMDAGVKPGSILLVNPEQIGGASFSTHSLPLPILIKFINRDLKCETIIIGVQPESIEFGETLSMSNRKAIFRLTKELSRLCLN